MLSIIFFPDYSCTHGRMCLNNMDATLLKIHESLQLTYFPIFFSNFQTRLSILQVFTEELALQRTLTQEIARLSSLNNLLSHTYASWSISGYKFRVS